LIIVQQVVVISYRRFGTNYRFRFQGLKMGSIGCPETSVRIYPYSLRNNPEERSCHLLRRGRLESSIKSDHNELVTL